MSVNNESTENAVKDPQLAHAVGILKTALRNALAREGRFQIFGEEYIYLEKGADVVFKQDLASDDTYEVTAKRSGVYAILQSTRVSEGMSIKGELPVYWMSSDDFVDDAVERVELKADGNPAAVHQIAGLLTLSNLSVRIDKKERKLESKSEGSAPSIY